MKALVIYESMWGNTAKVAQAVARGLGGAPAVDVSTALPSSLADLDLLVIGGPTHAFSMTRPSTRRDAHAQGAAQGDEHRGIRELLAELPDDFTVPVAAFDTRVGTVRHFPGSASKAAVKELRRHHARVVARRSFFVDDNPGPLSPGELERARSWGVGLARGLGSR